MGVQSFVSGGKPSYRIKASGQMRAYPSLADGVLPAHPGTAWTFGPWVQVVGTTAVPIYVMGYLMQQNFAPEGVFQLGIGAAGVEQAIADYYNSNPGNEGTTEWLPSPQPIPAGTRIAVRYAGTGTTAVSNRFRLLYINQADLEAF